MKVRTEVRRTAILEAAAGLFSEMGYERASMNELARRLGGSKATLYGYFASKEELFVAVVESYATANLRKAAQDLALVEQEPATLESRLIKFGERMLAVLVNDKSALAVYRMVIAEAGRSNIGTLFQQSGPAEALKAISALLARANERGELRLIDPDLAANYFLALVTAETNARLLEQNPQPLAPQKIRQMVRRAVNMFLLGAAPR